MKMRNLLLPFSLLTFNVATPAVFAVGDTPMTEGVVINIDASTGEITIKHGPIIYLGMPPMSMVLGVEYTAILEDREKGVNVKFNVLEKDGKMIIEGLETVN